MLCFPKDVNLVNILCRTEEEATLFCEELHHLGYGWNDYDEYTLPLDTGWSNHKDDLGIMYEVVIPNGVLYHWDATNLCIGSYPYVEFSDIYVDNSSSVTDISSDDLISLLGGER